MSSFRTPGAACRCRGWQSLFAMLRFAPVVGVDAGRLKVRAVGCTCSWASEAASSCLRRKRSTSNAGASMSLGDRGGPVVVAEAEGCGHSVTRTRRSAVIVCIIGCEERFDLGCAVIGQHVVTCCSGWISHGYVVEGIRAVMGGGGTTSCPSAGVWAAGIVHCMLLCMTGLCSVTVAAKADGCASDQRDVQLRRHHAGHA